MSLGNRDQIPVEIILISRNSFKILDESLISVLNAYPAVLQSRWLCLSLRNSWVLIKLEMYIPFIFWIKCFESISASSTDWQRFFGTNYPVPDIVLTKIAENCFAFPNQHVADNDCAFIYKTETEFKQFMSLIMFFFFVTSNNQLLLLRKRWKEKSHFKKHKVGEFCTISFMVPFW